MLLILTKITFLVTLNLLVRQKEGHARICRIECDCQRGSVRVQMRLWGIRRRPAHPCRRSFVPTWGFAAAADLFGGGFSPAVRLFPQLLSAYHSSFDIGVGWFCGGGVEEAARNPSSITCV